MKIADGLGRPVPVVKVEVSCVSDAQKAISLHLLSDQDGTVHGTYDAALCKPLFVSVEKDGYGSYSSGFRSQYILRRDFRAEDLSRVIRLDGEDQRHELRELLAGEFSSEEHQFRDLVFYYEVRLRPALRTLARDPEITERARDLLAMIGVSEDLHLIMQLAPPPVTLGFKERWRYAVATTLVNPDDEDEWSFLRRCALNEFDDRWVDEGAIQTLKLTASPRSAKMLEEAREKNKKRASLIARALGYIKSNPAPLANGKAASSATDMTK